jgi:hypothetical protein
MAAGKRPGTVSRSVESSSRLSGKTADHVLVLPKAAQIATRGRSVTQRKRLNACCVRPRGVVALFVQHAPDVDVLGALDA